MSVQFFLRGLGLFRVRLTLGLFLHVVKSTAAAGLRKCYTYCSNVFLLLLVKGSEVRNACLCGERKLLHWDSSCTRKHDFPQTHTHNLAVCLNWIKRRLQMFSFRLAYVFSYNLFQFCGHTWILANTITRFLMFGQDALADTFYSVGFVMSLCQLFSILELFHIADGIEKARLLPRFIQVMEKNLLLVIIIMLEEIQSKPVVCVQFFFWNILDLLRYPHELLCIMEKPSTTMLWTRYSLWIPLYGLSVIIEGVTIYQALPYVEQTASHCSPPNSTVVPNIHLPFVLVLYLPILTLGASLTVWQLLKERQWRTGQLEKWNRKRK